MNQLFGRKAAHTRCDLALEELRHGTPTEQAIGCNVRTDHRVCQEREDYVLAPCTSDGVDQLERALTRNFKREIRRSLHPQFSSVELNAENIIGDTHGHLLLVRAIKLNGLHAVFTWAREQQLDPVWQDFPKGRPGDPDFLREIHDWLGRNIGDRNASDPRDFAGRVIQVLELHSRIERFQPSWACYWERIRAIEDQHVLAYRWLEILGVPNSFAPCWVMLLRYPAREVGGLVRPTVLDCGWHSEYHFPSPPQVPLAAGGYAMDLGGECPDTRLTSEYIHENCMHQPGHYANIGEATRRTDINELPRLRREHHELLKQSFGAPDITSWMDAPM